jgi:ribosome-binding protein aMBF1 (putative translation factor)
LGFGHFYYIIIPNAYIIFIFDYYIRIKIKNRDMSIYQDWTPVTIGNGGNKKKTNTGISNVNKKLNELENNDDMPPKIQHWTPELINALQQARMAKGLSQVELAKKLNIQPSYVQDIENNKSQYNRKLYLTLMRTLGVNTKELKLPS